MSRFSPTEKKKCAERELGMRIKVYPRFVELGKMTQKKADREIALITEIIEDYRRAEEFNPALPLLSPSPSGERESSRPSDSPAPPTTS